MGLLYVSKILISIDAPVDLTWLFSFNEYFGISRLKIYNTLTYVLQIFLYHINIRF